MSTFRTADGGRIAYQRQEFAAFLMDDAWLDSLPAGSVGAAYRDFIRSEHLPVTAPRPAPASTETSAAPNLPAGGVNLEAIERSLVVKALTQARHNKTRAAKLLGLTRAQLYSRIEKYGLAETES